MRYVPSHKTSKANSISLFFVCAILGLAIVSLVVSRVGESFQGESFIRAPVTLSAAATQKPPQSNPSVAMIPAGHFDASVKDVPQKVAVVPKAVQEITESHLQILSIGVDAVIKETGVTSDGAMAVPDNRVDVGWFSLGTRPGETGSAVIGGHNRWNSRAAVFDRLDELKKGDLLSVVDAKGTPIFFVVRDIRTFDATDTDSGIFESQNGVHLNLITCSGEWDPTTTSYTKRLVVFTDVVQASVEIAMAPIQTP